MSFADRLSVVKTESPGGFPRWSIKWDNEGSGRKDLHIINFHASVPKETADAVLALIRSDGYLQRVLK